MATVNVVEESFDNTIFSVVHNIVMHLLLQIIQCFRIGTQIFFQKNSENTEDIPCALLSDSGVYKNP